MRGVVCVQQRKRYSVAQLKNQLYYYGMNKWEPSLGYDALKRLTN